MEQRISVNKSLPPFVEGKIHGYLEFVIDKIFWIRRPNILISVSWWGEVDHAEFRLLIQKDGSFSSEKNAAERYAIKTNLNLFKEYLKNADNLKILIQFEKARHNQGKARVTKLLNIVSGKSFTQSCPIVNSVGTKIGEVNVRMKLTMARNPKNSKKSMDCVEKKLETMQMPLELSPERNIKSGKYDLINLELSERRPLEISSNTDNKNIYRSILKDKRSDFYNVITKSSSEIADILVSQVVERAQKLRGEITSNLKMNDMNNVEPLYFDENLSEESTKDSAEMEAVLYKYFLGEEMSARSEKNALKTLRTNSPTASLIESAAETIRLCNENPLELVGTKKKVYEARNFRTEQINDDDKNGGDCSDKNCLQEKKDQPLNYIDSIKIVVDSLTLNHAGHRRVTSFSSAKVDVPPLSVTYFIQYEPTFASVRDLKNYNKRKTASKLAKMCSRRQDGSIVYFDHVGVYDFSKHYLDINKPLEFKLFYRHINQKTPVALGVGTIHISDAAKSLFFSTTQKVAIVKKGIKVAELKVKVQLGCDKVHFGKQFIDAITSTKENIPVLEVSSTSNNNHKNTSQYKTMTGNDSKSTSKSSFNGSDKQQKISYSSNTNSQDANMSQHKKNAEERRIKVDEFDDSRQKILLHGLIYIGSGKELPELTTYLVCRAFWKEDRTMSRVCNGTMQPFYHFLQLVPLIYGSELLERTKDNCIIIEVYSKHVASEDRFIGIAKLSVHQLYVAFRDPQVMTHLLNSKYPVISVDGWVPIINPISGESRGQLSVLVALGTADQIAFLEMARGLRKIPTPIQSNVSNVINDYFHAENEGKNDCQRFDQRRCRDDNLRIKSQECQTQITTISDFKRQLSDESQYNREDTAVLHTIIDRLAQALSVPRTISDRGAQTELDFSGGDPHRRSKTCNIEPLRLDRLNSNSYFDESSNQSPRDNFNMPTELFRSVGVGAEFDDDANQATSSLVYGVKSNDNGVVTSFHLDESPEIFEDEDNRQGTSQIQSSELKHVERALNSNTVNSDCNRSFGAIIEVECALHLPKINKNSQLVDPCTYVTFQKFASNTNNGFDDNMITDVCQFSCNPRYDWRCDTKLSTDLLTKANKKFILKIWRLTDPTTSMKANLEKDEVIGCAALDLSALTSGHPTVSGWFHVLDFEGNVKGKLKASVTPLDDISVFEGEPSEVSCRIPLVANINKHPRVPTSYSESAYKIGNHSSIKKHCSSGAMNGVENKEEIEPLIDFGLGFGVASMSLLSQSLKEKLCELDGIKHRLQSRLQDVTCNAFDDFEADLDIADYEDDEKNGNEENNVHDQALWQSHANDNHSDNHVINKDRFINGNQRHDNDNPETQQSSSEYQRLPGNLPDAGYSSSFHSHSSKNLSNGNVYKKNLSTSIDSPVSKISLSNFECHQPDSGPDNRENFNSHLDQKNSVSENHCNQEKSPIRGTRMHIDHLLDKLSTQLSSAPPLVTGLPMERNIIELIGNLRRNNNNNFSHVKCNREVNVCPIPTQTDINGVDDFRSNNSINNASLHERAGDKDVAANPAKHSTNGKISTIIREELIADDKNDNNEHDSLSTHLITSNRRHINYFHGLTPFLYPHTIPDLTISENGSSDDCPNLQQQQQQEESPSSTEREAAVRLDYRYVKTFDNTVNREHERSSNQSRVELRSEMREDLGCAQEKIDGSIDVTVIHKPSNDGLMPSNSADSIVVTPFDNATESPTSIGNSTSSNSSETSVFVVSRQAPDGGNPIEDVGSSFITKNKKSADSLSTES